MRRSAQSRWCWLACLVGAAGCGGDEFPSYQPVTQDFASTLSPLGDGAEGMALDDAPWNEDGGGDAGALEDGGDEAAPIPLDFALASPPDLSISLPDLVGAGSDFSLSPSDRSVSSPDRFGSPPDQAISGDAPNWQQGPPSDGAGFGDAAVDEGVHVGPSSIVLTDITLDALGGLIRSGRSSPQQWGLGQGVAIADLDGDGKLDLVLGRSDDPKSQFPGGPTLLLRNDTVPGKSPHFTNDPALAKLLAGVKAHGVAVGDYDRDGDLDLFIAAEGRDWLLANDGAGHFTDVTDIAGVAGPNADYTTHALFVDLNHDGLLDLYVVNFNDQIGQVVDSGRKRLYLNVGDGTFADVSKLSGTDNTGCSHAAAAFDLDGLGDLGIYVANDRFTANGIPGVPAVLPDSWYQLTAIDDTGIPLFTDVAAARGVQAWRSCMGVNLADVDGDLTPDIYLPDIGKNWLYLQKHPGQATVAGVDQFNLGNQSPNGVALMAWGSRFIDLDRDGLLELIVANGYLGDPVGCEAMHQLPRYFQQQAPGSPYTDITAAVGLSFFTPPRCPGPMGGDVDRVTSRAFVMGDLDGDGDGDDDFVLAPYSAPFYLFRNDTVTANHALRVRLVGTVSSPNPIGATLLAEHMDGTKTAMFQYAGGDDYSFADPVLTVGMGAEAKLARAEVKWPSGIVQRIDQLPGFALDQVFVVSEPKWLTVEPRAVKKGDAAAQLVYRPVGSDGAFLGKAGAGQKVIVTRSDGKAVALTDQGDGSYVAALGYPDAPRRTTIKLNVDGRDLRPRPMINFK